LILDSFHLTDFDDVQNLAAVIPKGAVVFIDTLNRAAPTADENASKDMGAIIEGANMLRLLTDGLVVLVHHTGKDTAQGMRGHSSLFAALDGAIEVKRNNAGRTWTVAKTKDGEDGKTTPFKLMVHDLGTDADGEPITSCTVEVANASIFAKAPPKHDGPKKVFKELAKLISSGVGTVIGIKGAPIGASCLKMDDAIAAVAASLVTAKPNKRKYTAKLRIESLTSSGHLGGCIDANGDGWCWIEP
jgi:putative DNA primase/helicase